MNHRNLALAATLLALLPARTCAQTDPGFEVGLDLFDYRNDEAAAGADTVRSGGTFVGLSLRYVETLADGWSVAARAEGAHTRVDYRADTGARIDDAPLGVARFELAVARDLRLSDVATLTPSFGIGGRLLEDRSGGRTASDGTPAYDRDIAYTYLPLGVTLGLSTPGRTRLALSARYAWIVGGEIESRLSQVDRALPDLTLGLRGGRLLEAGADVGVRLGRRRLLVGPFVRLWRVDASRSRRITFGGSAIDVFEPRSRTTEAGARVAVAF